MNLCVSYYFTWRINNNNFKTSLFGTGCVYRVCLRPGMLSAAYFIANRKHSTVKNKRICYLSHVYNFVKIISRMVKNVNIFHYNAIDAFILAKLCDVFSFC